MILLTNTAAQHGSQDFDAYSIKITSAQVAAFLDKVEPEAIQYCHTHGFVEVTNNDDIAEVYTNKGIRGTVVEDFDPFERMLQEGEDTFVLIQPETNYDADHYRLTVYYPTSRPQWKVLGTGVAHYATLGRAFHAFIGSRDNAQLSASINTRYGADNFIVATVVRKPTELTLEESLNGQESQVGSISALRLETPMPGLTDPFAFVEALNKEDREALSERLKDLLLATTTPPAEEVEKDNQSSFRLPFASKS